MKSVFSLLLLLFSYSSFSAHLVSSFISYQKKGNQYKFTLFLLTDCSANVPIFPSTANIATNTLPSSIPVSLVQTIPYNQSCPTSFHCGQTTGYFALAMRIYESNWLFLNTVPPSGFNFSYESCCTTPYGNMANNSLPITTTLKIYPQQGDFNGHQVVPSNYYVSNVDTNITQFPWADLQSDSVNYELTQPKNKTGTPHPYNTGYTIAAPLGTSTLHTSIAPLNWNPHKGSGTFLNPITGTYLMANQVVAYEDSRLKYEAYGTYPVVVSTTPPGNNAPKSNLTTTSNANIIIVDTNHYKISGKMSDTLRAILLGLDYDTIGSGAFQQVTLIPQNNQNLSCFNNICIEFSPGLGQTNFSNGAISAADLKIYSNTNHPFRYKKATFFATITDNYCPISKTVTAQFDVEFEANFYLKNSDTVFVCQNDSTGLTLSGDITNVIVTPNAQVSFDGDSTYYFNNNSQNTYTFSDTVSGHSFNVYVKKVNKPNLYIQSKNNKLTLSDKIDPTGIWYYQNLPIIKNRDTLSKNISGAFKYHSTPNGCSRKTPYFFLNNNAVFPVSDTLGSSGIMHAAGKYTFDLNLLATPKYFPVREFILFLPTLDNSSGDSAVTLRIYNSGNLIHTDSAYLEEGYFYKFQKDFSFSTIVGKFTIEIETKEDGIRIFLPYSFPYTEPSGNFRISNPQRKIGQTTMAMSGFPYFQIYAGKDLGIKTNPASNFSVFPNPADQSLFIESDKGYILTDLSGKVLLQSTTGFSGRISTAGLPNGVYIIAVPGNPQKRKKIVIAHQ